MAIAMRITVLTTVTDPDGGEEETEHTIPARYAICGRCRGKGSHVNPNIDGNGITADEWNGPDWDDESREMYMSGGYDVACDAGCENGKVLEPDVEHASPEVKALVALWQDQQNERARWDAEDRRTRMMESGGWDR